MPEVLELKGEVKQAMVGHVKHPNIKLEALDVAIERCFDVPFDAHETVEGFLDADNGRYLGKS